MSANRRRLKAAAAAAIAAMSDEQLEALAAGLDPEISQRIVALPDDDLEALAQGRITPAAAAAMRGKTCD